MEEDQLWERLIEEQSALFRKTIQKNSELGARIEELERELLVWKLAFKSNDEEKCALKKQVSRLQRSIGSLKEDCPLVLCLIDGDGNIFSQELVSQGRVGGSQAAQLLTMGITEYLAQTEDDKAPSSISGRAQIWISVYFNKSGLQEIFTSLQLCTVEQFEAFVMGFNQASPLFSLTDVGNGKEAADTKIKEYLRVFTRFPQTLKVFFGGGHDNGYASTLNALNNESLLDKIVLLRGYKAIAFEVKSLNLPSVEFTGVFMTEKLPHINQYRKNNGQSPTENERRAPRLIANNGLLSPSKPRLKLKQQIDSLCLTKYNPPPCNFFYLAMCKTGSTCRFSHSYELEPQELSVLRVNAKKSPCGAVNRNKTCILGDQCPLGHVCPAGPKCKFGKAGRCKFLGQAMHDPLSRSVSPGVHRWSTGSGSEIRPATPGQSIITDLDSPFLPNELSPVPGSNAWTSRHFSPYQALATPPDQADDESEIYM